MGQTVQDVGVRIRQGYASTTQIGAAIQTHGLESFTYRVLKTGITTKQNLNEWENHYIGFHGTLLNGYNEKLA